MPYCRIFLIRLFTKIIKNFENKNKCKIILPFVENIIITIFSRTITAYNPLKINHLKHNQKNNTPTTGYLKLFDNQPFKHFKIFIYFFPQLQIMFALDYFSAKKLSKGFIFSSNRFFIPFCLSYFCRKIKMSLGNGR